jgi:hypothetical protein
MGAKLYNDLPVNIQILNSLAILVHAFRKFIRITGPAPTTVLYRTDVIHLV